ncbi:porin family protein [Tellurirhabdus rosea]|uniref:hypothetical protein n=1 Tax=Tellurirhabdus rosea TaxID=2674997 RepID=UPI00225C2A41|nr:hypothetical protein [Tellurirhabdus rosea]
MKNIKMLAAAGLVAFSAFSAQAQVSLKSISVGAGYWKPSLDYWNKESVMGQAGGKFDGAIAPTLALEVGVVKGLSVGARVSSWKQSASSPISIAGINRTEKLTLSIIPVALDVKYAFAKPVAEGEKQPFLTPYAGVSVARYFVKNEFNRVVEKGTGSVNETQAGNNYGFQVFVGAEKQLVKKLYLALDLRYHLGSYKQAVKTVTGSGSTAVTTSSSQDVSLNGVEAGLSLRYKFK